MAELYGHVIFCRNRGVKGGLYENKRDGHYFKDKKIDGLEVSQKTLILAMSQENNKTYLFRGKKSPFREGQEKTILVHSLVSRSIALQQKRCRTDGLATRLCGLMAFGVLGIRH